MALQGSGPLSPGRPFKMALWHDPVIFARMARLSCFWFIYMAGLGLVYPLQAVWYEESAGFTGWKLGLVLALRPLIGIFGQPFFGRMADLSGARALTLAGVLCGAACAYAVLPWAPNATSIIAIAAVAAFFGTSVMPLGTSVSMAGLGESQSHRFGHVRVWGTLGYAIALFAFPRLLEVWRNHQGLRESLGAPDLGAIFIGMALFCLLAALVAIRLPREGLHRARSQPGDLQLLLRHRPYLVLLAVTFLGHCLMQGPILFFPFLVAERGGNLTDVSNLWLPMLGIEIVLILFSSQGFQRFGAKSLIAAGIFADGLRWLLTLLAPNLGWMAWPQCLHGVVIAGFLIGTSLYVEQIVPDRLRATGQAGLAMIGVSMAAALSSLWVGAMKAYGGIETPFWISGIGATVLGIAIFFVLPEPKRMHP